MGVSKNNGIPKSSILIGFSSINHPFWGAPIFGNTQMDKIDGGDSKHPKKPLRRFQALTANWPWGRGSGARLATNLVGWGCTPTPTWDPHGKSQQKKTYITGYFWNQHFLKNP